MTRFLASYCGRISSPILVADSFSCLGERQGCDSQSEIWSFIATAIDGRVFDELRDDTLHKNVTYEKHICLNVVSERIITYNCISKDEKQCRRKQRPLDALIPKTTRSPSRFPQIIPPKHRGDAKQRRTSRKRKPPENGFRMTGEDATRGCAGCRGKRGEAKTDVRIYFRGKIDEWKFVSTRGEIS